VVNPLKVTASEHALNGEGAAPAQERGGPERDLSAQNKAATTSPSTMDAAPFDKGRLKEALKAADRLTDYSNRKLKFEYQEEADVFQVSIMDGGDEIIRKIPPDSVLRMIENLKRFRGSTVDTKA
jgi:flagellar protein FlaG